MTVQQPIKFFFLMQAAILKFLGRFPLRVVLIVPFVVQIFVIVSLVGWLSFRSGQQAVNNVASQLRQEITARIEDTLNVYLETPHVVNRINFEAIRLGQLDLRNIPSIEKYLWNQIQQFDTVSMIALGTEFGDYIEMQRFQDGAVNIGVKDENTNGILQIWATDARGNRTKLLENISDYDPRVRPWYLAAVKTKVPVWTEIYPYVSDETLAISANQPFYSNRKKLAAVASTDLTLSQINNFLGSLEVGKTGHTFIMERSGLLVASSTGEPPTVATNSEGELERLNAIDSQNLLISQTAQHLAQQYNSLDEITSNRQLDFNIDGQTYFLQVTPYKDPRGIDWLIAVVIPQSDFMTQINANVQTTIILSFIALVVAIIVGIITTRWVVYPILSLNIAAGNLAAGNWNQSIPVDRTDELGGLAISFNSMARQLKDSFDTLQASEEKYRTLFEDSRDMIYISTPAGQIVDANSAGLSLFGYTKEELLEINALDLYANSDDRSKFRQEIEQYGEVKDFEIKFRKKDGTELDCMITATLRQADDGTLLGYQGLIRDITVHKRAEIERLKLTAIQQELSIAHDMQGSLLPDFYPEWTDIEVVCYSIPAKDVGGDFYQYHQFETFEVSKTAQKYAFAIGDVSGKGVSAALLMATSLSQFDASLTLDLTPAERMTHLDKTISPYTKPRRQNCAMCYVELRIMNYESPVGEASRLRIKNSSPAMLRADELNMDNDEVEKQFLIRDSKFLIDVVNAGCIPPYIKRVDGSVEFDEEMGGFSLGQGLGARHGYQAHTIELSPGDMVILTSDGVVEANNNAGDMLGFDRLMEIVRGFEPDTSFASQDLQGFKNLEGLNLSDGNAMLEHLKQEVFVFTEGAEQHDDMTIVVVRV
ncbi:SpoIIE family protein phosphatase [Anaerolineales bacterium HSG24]|nr:SpoIIE family protein phosphatase [Anaerolineales bacterium HSG24]